MMVTGGRLSVPPESLVGLRRRLDTMPDRADVIKQAAALYGVSTTTLYRQLRTLHRPRPIRRADRGRPRKVPIAELERWCEIIAALKLHTTNKIGASSLDRPGHPTSGGIRR
ncbi:Integrase catalytic subunit [Acidiphilium sp. PM]|nr:Integrase catalytic subunit [Acidiphilium sp. PM]